MTYAIARVKNRYSMVDINFMFNNPMANNCFIKSTNYVIVFIIMLTNKSLVTFWRHIHK